jgi:hypothetical protein
MARGLRREVRNDLPCVGESWEQMRQRRADEYFEASKPSANKPVRRRMVPPGCVSVYRVHRWHGGRNSYYGIYRDEAEAYRVADAEWRKIALGIRVLDLPSRVEVEHKAAIELDGRFFLVNLDPIKFTEPSSVAVLLGGNGTQEATQ